MKVKSLVAIAAMSILAACGGGGGGGSDSTPPAVTPPVVTPPAVTPPVVTPPITSVTCPDGTSAATAASCAAVTASSSIAAGAVVDPAVVNAGLTIQFSGAVRPASAVYSFTQGDVPMYGALIANSASTAVTFVSSVRMGYGQADVFALDINDALGRPLHVQVRFTTAAMSCSSNAIWSNPATFSPQFQDCVAPLGVQALMDPTRNKMQDNSCTFTVGTRVSAECAKYAANGTLLLADTTIVVQNNPVLWVAFFDQNGSGTLALVDKTTLVTLGAVSENFAWIIGNPTGAAVRLGSKTFQARWDGAAVALTCVAGC